MTIKCPNGHTDVKKVGELNMSVKSVSVKVNQVALTSPKIDRYTQYYKCNICGKEFSRDS